ncbi:MAG: putative lipoprotein [Devosia sp.]|uniref:SHOCT domain-containing protein n=1 Tax=Devosia sp. TaxID=1871048 RepID=UPI00263851FB|nr:SHOCT domain-containing protein [Devosia sp.]MDB5528117.1 putative lipoprotein [Devosia sp.]
MRVAIIILGLCLGIGVAVQSFIVGSAASFTRNEAMSAASSSGIISALLLVVGAAFAFSLPRASIGLFGLAAFLAIQAGSTSQFHDLRVWGFVAVALTVMSYFGDRELRARHPKALQKERTASLLGGTTQPSTGDGTGWRGPLFGNYQQPPADAVEQANSTSSKIDAAPAPRRSPTASTDVVHTIAPPPVADVSLVDQIERLAALKATGAIDEAEYQTLKLKVIDASHH